MIRQERRRAMKTYVSPELELISFETEDVLTTSYASFEEFMNACQGVREVTGQTGYEDCTRVFLCPSLNG